MTVFDPVVLAILSVLLGLAAMTLAGVWAVVEVLGWWAQRERNGRLGNPVLTGLAPESADIGEPDDEDPWLELDVAWLAEHQICGWRR